MIEIRNPPTAGPVDNLFDVAESIYNAVDDAIRYPNGKGSDEEPVAPRDYRNVLTPGQIQKQNQARERAQALQQRLQQLDESLDDSSSEDE